MTVVYLDSCVLIYALDEDPQFGSNAWRNRWRMRTANACSNCFQRLSQASGKLEIHCLAAC